MFEIRECCRRPAGAFISTPSAPRATHRDGSEAVIMRVLDEPPTLDEAEAYHEAGHAVAFHCFGGTISTITIEAQPQVSVDRSAVSLRDKIVGLLAGPAAMDRYGGCETTLYSTELAAYFARVDEVVFGNCDHCQAGLIASVACGRGGIDREALFREGERRANELVRQRPVWLAIRALAAELMREPTLSGKKAHSIVEPFVRLGSMKEEVQNAG